MGKGFTLLEIAVALVIIGLVIGGVVIGRDLVLAGEVRSQISQIEGLASAINTFKVKTGYLPGDIPATHALELGLEPRDGTAGSGDGNNRIQQLGGEPSGYLLCGESILLIDDLNKSGLLGGAPVFNGDYGDSCKIAGSTEEVSQQLISARIGRGNSLWYHSTAIGSLADNSLLAYLHRVPSITPTGPSSILSGMTPVQAFAIDKKSDDGFPVTGQIQATQSFDFGGGMFLPLSIELAVAFGMLGAYGDGACVIDNGAILQNPYNLAEPDNAASSSCGLAMRLPGL